MDVPSLHPAPEQIPAGFALVERGGPFFQALGRVYVTARDDEKRVLGVRIDASHTNMQGNAHGGMLMTLADGALNTNLAMHYPGGVRLVTVGMNTNFLSPASVGDWLEADVAVTRTGQRLCFAECTLSVGDRTVLRAQAVFASRGTGTPAA